MQKYVDEFSIFTTMRHLYILECADGTYYTGMTLDLERRLSEHNDSDLGAKYTKARRPVSLVWSKSGLTRNEAASEEYRIKKLPKDKKKMMIA